MNRLSLCAALLSLLSLTASAAPLDEFHARARGELIKPFALDLGGLLGATGFHKGRPIGFPGFELSVVGAAQFRPDKDNLILRDSGVKAFGLPVVHAAVALPFKIDVAAHGMKVGDAKVFGGGIRYGVVKNGLLTKFMPDIGLSVFADKVNHADFNAVHYAGNVNAGWDLPIVKPFFGFGVDSTKVTAGSAATPGVAGLSATAKGTRVAAGVEVVPFPFANIRAAYMLLHGVPGALFSLGAKF